jgi:prepilin-type N-terminal cleavage/methylation domain-containing protein
MPPFPHPHPPVGFTLLEMSVVLAIIALVIGSVLVGSDLIAIARIHAQLTQIDAYDQGLAVFKDKYNAMPGDISAPMAMQFGFQARSGASGHGNGDGNLEPCSGFPGAGATEVGCELVLFWRDLSDAQLITGQFQGIDDWAASLTGSMVGQYFPSARIGYGTYVTVLGSTDSPTLGQGSWFVLAGIQSTDATGFYTLTPTMTPLQASSIDAKIDDGMPMTGIVKFLSSTGGNLTVQNIGASECANNVASTVYNTVSPFANQPLCGLFIKMTHWFY